MGEGRGASKLRNAARKMVSVCGSFSSRQAVVDPVAIHTITASNVLGGSEYNPKKRRNISEISDGAEANTSLSTKSLCAICLDPLNYINRDSTNPGKAIFTAQCSHSFHFACISSNVRHGNITCPICRDNWTQLPLNKLSPHRSSPCNYQSDPTLQILDDTIATFRVHRRSFSRYNDDDPVEPHNHNHHLLKFCLVQPSYQTDSDRAYLTVKMRYQQATDLVMVVSPNGPHLRLLKQAMALAVLSLRSIDRLSIVSHSSSAARVFPLRRMTAYGKRAALQVIDRLFFTGYTNPLEGLKKGLKILGDCIHKNPRSCILHMSDTPIRSYPHWMDMEDNIPIHRFHVNFGLGTSSGLVMHEFEEFLARMLGNVIREVELWIGDEEGRMMTRLGEVRSGEERRVALDMEVGEVRDIVYVGYSYVEGGLDECNVATGETMVNVQEKRQTSIVEIN